MVKSLLAVAWLSGAHRTAAALATGWLRGIFDFEDLPEIPKTSGPKHPPDAYMIQ